MTNRKRSLWGVYGVRSVEYYELGNGELGIDLIVNVTDYRDIEEVKIELSRHWTWESQEGPEVLAGEEGEGATEWLTLKGATRSLTASRSPEEVAA